jgi:hypothetical protein
MIDVAPIGRVLFRPSRLDMQGSSELRSTRLIRLRADQAGVPRRAAPSVCHQMFVGPAFECPGFWGVEGPNAGKNMAFSQSAPNIAVDKP